MYYELSQLYGLSWRIILLNKKHASIQIDLDLYPNFMSFVEWWHFLQAVGEFIEEWEPWFSWVTKMEMWRSLNEKDVE